MNHATRRVTRKFNSVDLLARVSQAAMVVAGMVVIGGLSNRYLDRDPVAFADIGGVVNETRTAAVAVPVSAPVSAPVRRVATVEDALSSEMKRVRDYVADRYNLPTTALDPALEAAEHHGRSSGIDPMLIVAVMAIESSFNPVAVSRMGAQGLMQVIPRYHKDKIGDARGKNPLFDPRLNVRVGTEVLAEGLRRFGSMQTALQYYGGALGDPNASYANKVLAMKKRLVSAAGRSARARTDA
jgi:soluble lytic murein transglycosylase-like protein